MAQKAKSRRPGGGRVAVTPTQNNASNGSTNGFHKMELPLLGENHPLAKIAGSYKVIHSGMSSFN